MTEKTSPNTKPEWCGGVPYDPAFLPTKRGKALPDNFPEAFDIIVKSYDPTTDAYVYRRIADCQPIADWKPTTTTKRHIPDEDREIDWRFTNESGDLAYNRKTERVVAVIPLINAKEAYDHRILPADDLIDRAIARTLDTP